MLRHAGQVLNVLHILHGIKGLEQVSLGDLGISRVEQFSSGYLRAFIMLVLYSLQEAMVQGAF